MKDFRFSAFISGNESGSQGSHSLGVGKGDYLPFKLLAKTANGILVEGYTSGHDYFVPQTAASTHTGYSLGDGAVRTVSHIWTADTGGQLGNGFAFSKNGAGAAD